MLEQYSKYRSFLSHVQQRMNKIIQIYRLFQKCLFFYRKERVSNFLRHLGSSRLNFHRLRINDMR